MLRIGNITYHIGMFGKVVVIDAKDAVSDVRAKDVDVYIQEQEAKAKAKKKAKAEAKRQRKSLR